MAAFDGTSLYPGGTDSFNRIGTGNYEDETGYEHDLGFNEHSDALEKVQVTLGTTAGTSVLKDFSAGHFPARVNSGGTIAQTLMGGTINSVTLGTPTVTGGTVNNVTLGTPTINTPTIRAWDGWIDANETWTYASASTFTVPGDVTVKYLKGTKLKWTQTTVKYGVVVANSYSAPNTTVTIAVNTDYTIANAVISANFYSYETCPQGYSGWFTWTPVYSASGLMTFTSVTTDVAKFQVIGSTCFVQFGCRGTTGGTADISLEVTLPIASINSTFIIGGGAVLYDGGQLGGFWSTVGITEVAFSKYNNAIWGLGTTKDAKANFHYEI
jgi:hypothetical protein